VKSPKVAGLKSAEAIKRLEALEFQVNTITEQSDTVPLDIVIRTDPKAGKAVAPNSVVLVVISAGPAPISVPDVSGKSQTDATSTLSAAGFRVSLTSDSSSSVPVGFVIRTQPAAGTQAPRDSTVTLVISTGPKQVTVPDVTGASQESATSTLEGAGLKVSVVTITSPGNAGKVISQNPAGGSRVNDGTTVTITVGAAATTTSSSSTTSSTT